MKDLGTDIIESLNQCFYNLFLDFLLYETNTTLFLKAALGLLMLMDKCIFIWYSCKMSWKISDNNYAERTVKVKFLLNDKIKCHIISVAYMYKSTYKHVLISFQTCKIFWFTPVLNYWFAECCLSLAYVWLYIHMEEFGNIPSYFLWKCKQKERFNFNFDLIADLILWKV